MSTVNLAVTLPAERVRPHYVTARGFVVVHAGRLPGRRGPTYGSPVTVSPWRQPFFVLFLPGVYTCCPRRGKIGSGCPLAHRAFGVWITPLSVSRRPSATPPWPAPRLPLEVIEWMAAPTGSSN